MNKYESKYFNTARLMNEALLLLLENKDYEYITVKEICSKAGVNRSTFYLHYETIDDLLQETIEYIKKQFFNSFNGAQLNKEIINRSSLEELVLITPEYLTPYLQFLKDNKNVFILINKKPSLFNSEMIFEKMYKELFIPILNKFDVAKENQVYVFEFYFKGVFAIITKWLSLDCNLSINELISIIKNCVRANNYE